MRIIALDLGVTTGIAIGTEGGDLVMSGCMKFAQDKTIAGDSRFYSFYSWLRDIVKDMIDNDNQPILLSLEKPNHMPGIAGTRIHFGFSALVNAIVSEFHMECEIQYTSATSIKKFWTGSGKGGGKEGKKLMIAKTQERYPEVTQNDESDSIALFHLTQENL